MTNLSYTGSSDEAWFYLISVAMEARGATVFPQLLDAMRAAHEGDETRVTEGLIALATCINDLSVLLARMYERCDPYVFYHVIRPYLAGSKNMTAAGLPNGVFYDEGDGKGEWRQYSGGSNAQSSLIQFFDVFLGIKHFATGEGSGQTVKEQAFISVGDAREETRDKSVKAETRLTLVQDMRYYMPGGHRRFLEAVESSSTIQSFAMRRPESHPLRKAYETAVSALAALRTFHIQLVTRYIITPARMTIPWQAKKQLNLATASSAEAKTAANGIKPTDGGTGESLQLHGTGGTTLIPFLRQCRDETHDAASA